MALSLPEHVRNYTIAVSFITPTALLMVQTVEASPVWPMLLARTAGDRHRRVRGARRHRGRLRTQVPRGRAAAALEQLLSDEKLRPTPRPTSRRQ